MRHIAFESEDVLLRLSGAAEAKQCVRVRLLLVLVVLRGLTLLSATTSTRTHDNSLAQQRQVVIVASVEPAVTILIT